jgi:multicomponent K+:H+ antiporter subunit E
VTVLGRILPHPLLSAGVFALWMVLAPRPSVGHLLLAALLAVVIPLATRGFWPDRPRLRRPLLLVVLVARVVGDIVVANWEVAGRVLGRIERLRPGFLRVPLDIADPFLATVLGSIVSLTPGTVSIEIDRADGVLLVHGLDIDDEAAAIARIKARYESPLKEIFEC